MNAEYLNFHGMKERVGEEEEEKESSRLKRECEQAKNASNISK